MPDLDRFERTFQVGGWRGAYRLARERVASTEEVGDKLVKSLAKTLRANGGVPELPAMAEIVESSNGTSLLERFSALDAIVRAQDGHRPTKTLLALRRPSSSSRMRLTEGPYPAMQLVDLARRYVLPSWSTTSLPTRANT